MSDSFLSDLPSLVEDFLYTDEFFRSIPIITEDLLDINEALDRAEAGHLAGSTGKIGLAIRINTCIPGGPIPNTPAAFSLRGRIELEVYELPQLNRKPDDKGNNKRGLLVAEMIWMVMKNFRSSEEPNLNFWDGEATISKPLIVENGLVLHTVTLHFTGGNVDTTEIVATPVITGTESLIGGRQTESGETRITEDGGIRVNE